MEQPNEHEHCSQCNTPSPTLTECKFCGQKFCDNCAADHEDDVEIDEATNQSFSGASRVRSKLTAIVPSSDHTFVFERFHLLVAQAEEVAVDVAVVLAQERPPSVHEGWRP